MQRVNEVLDVEAALTEVENLQHQREERNAEKHHRRDVVAQSLDQKLRIASVGTDLLFHFTF